MVRQASLDALLERLSRQLLWRTRDAVDPRLPSVVIRARDYLHGHFQQDINLEDLAHACGVDRFRLSRAFKAAFGLAPHAYLVQLRLAQARRLLANGWPPAHVAIDRLRRPEPPGALVPAGLWLYAGNLPPILHKSSRSLVSCCGQSTLASDWSPSMNTLSFNQLLPFVLFAFVASITPGPTNLLILGGAVRHGLLAVLLLCSAPLWVRPACCWWLASGLVRCFCIIRCYRMAWPWGWPGSVGWLEALQRPGQWYRGRNLRQLSRCHPWRRTATDQPQDLDDGVVSGERFVGAGSGPATYGLYAAIFLLVALPCLTVWALLGRALLAFLHRRGPYGASTREWHCCWLHRPG